MAMGAFLINIVIISLSGVMAPGAVAAATIARRQLHLGPWEHIFYYEFDGKRRKRLLVKIIGE